MRCHDTNQTKENDIRIMLLSCVREKESDRMKYESPRAELLSLANDPIMVSLDDLFAINLWDMLLEEE